jgi:hypothetical protein
MGSGFSTIMKKFKYVNKAISQRSQQKAEEALA